jgi:hypothetical protein
MILLPRSRGDGRIFSARPCAAPAVREAIRTVGDGTVIAMPTAIRAWSALNIAADIAADQSESDSLPLAEEAGRLPLRPGSDDWSPAACRESLSALALLATSRWMA